MIPTETKNTAREPERCDGKIGWGEMLRTKGDDGKMGRMGGEMLYRRKTEIHPRMDRIQDQEWGKAKRK